jgi:hypothetical protein
MQMMVLFAELLVDWLKHAFITKFNEITAEVYKDFTITIAYDVVRSRDEKAFSDYSDQVARRMGFIPIPLSILLIRVLSQSLSFNSKQGFLLLGELPSPFSIAGSFSVGMVRGDVGEDPERDRAARHGL